MSGLGSIFNIAGSALSVHQYGIEVTSNNIANVNTPGYTRQTALLQSSSPEKINNLIMGRGVEIDSVSSVRDQFIERRLRDQKTSLSFSQEQNTYVKELEQVFSANSDGDVSSLLSKFWNSWQEVSNNPSGTSERNVLSDNSAMLSEGFNRLDSEVGSMKNELDDSLGKGIKEVNVLTRDIADLNQQIVAAEAGGKTAHTLRDVRSAKVDEVAQYMNVSSFETEQGALTLVGGNGHDLVQGSSSFNLKIEDDKVKISGLSYQDEMATNPGPGDQTFFDITKNINGGKIGGWLDMRDNVLTGYQNDLDALSNTLIWQVNSQHSQGTGLENFTKVTGSYQADDSSALLKSSGLSYQDKIATDDGTGGPVGFNLWVDDGNGPVLNSISIDNATTLDSLASQISNVDGVTATVNSDNLFEINSDSTHTFAFSDDSSHVLASLGINTFFTGDSANSMGINDTVESGGPHIAAGILDGNGNRIQGDNTNAQAMADLQFTTTKMGEDDDNRILGALDSTAENYYHTLLGSIGNTSAGIGMKKETDDAVVQQLTNMRDSLSSVSLDEEMVNLMSSQSAYSAAAKVITTADEMLDTLLNMK